MSRADEEKVTGAMVKITKLPPGKAIGADDLQIWARQRNAGLSGVPDDREQQNRLHIQKRRREKWLRPPRDIARDPWFSRLLQQGASLIPKTCSSPRSSSRRLFAVAKRTNPINPWVNERFFRSSHCNGHSFLRIVAAQNDIWLQSASRKSLL
jgi:hypothetical protein